MNIDRYSRQVLFSPIQNNGQKQLMNSSVLVIGVGALGTVACNHLVRSGVGNLRIVDRDYIEMSNLQRQMLFDEEDVKQALPKAIAAKNKLKKINSGIHIEAITDHVSEENIEELTEGIDVVIDGTDNFATRYLLNDICFKQNIPLAYGGVIGARGMSAFFIPNHTPCLRCVIGAQEISTGQTCDTVGVISPVVDIVSSIQVTNTLKYLTRNIQQIKNSMLTFDIWYGHKYEINFTKPNENCPTCQLQIYPSLNRKASDQELILCGRNTVQIHELSQIDLQKWEQLLSEVAITKRTPFLLKVEFDNDIQFAMFPDGRVLVQGTEDVVLARTWYDRYIGS